MCKKGEKLVGNWHDQSVSSENATPSNPDKLSPYDDEIDRFFGGVNDLSEKASRMTKRLVGQTCEHHRRHRRWQSRDPPEEPVDSYFSRPYQTRGDSALAAAHPEIVRSPFDLFNLFSDAAGVTPYGLFAYQSPSPREYNTCMKKGGASLWDSEGYWRCLFPNSQVPPRFLEYKKRQLAGQIVTKDDFEERALGAPPSKDGAIDLGTQGVFFKQFGDFLNWKNTNYENDRKLVEQQREQFQKSVSYDSANNTKENGERKLVGTSLNSSTNSERGEVVMKECKTEYFSDGTSVTNSVIKRKPQGADSWASVEEKSERGDKQGWFWK